MNGVTYITLTDPNVKYHSYSDFGLILGDKEIGTPEPKTEYIDIPGGDGVIDLTEFFGEVKYGNREVSHEYSTLLPFTDVFQKVQNALHGQRMMIVHDDDPEWYYIGRLAVSEWKAKKRIGEFTVDCDCEPWRYKVEKTVVTKIFTENASITLTNSRKKAIPEITVATEDTIQLIFGYGTWELSAGSYTLPDFELVEGDNIVRITGTGTITFEWLEGGL